MKNLAKLRVATFPFHQPYQSLQFRNEQVEWYLIDGYRNIWWDIQEQSNPDIACQNNRALPLNVKRITIDDFLDHIHHYDVLLLPTADHGVWFQHLRKQIATIFTHANTEPVGRPFKDMVGLGRIIHTCTYSEPLRSQDVFIPHGHDPEEFRYNQTGKSGIVFPTNRFKDIGERHPHPDRFGWDYRGLIPALSVDVYGNNPLYSKEYDECFDVPFQEYRYVLPTYEIGLQLGWQRHRTFTTSEMMLSEIIVIARDEKNHFPDNMKTFIKNGENGYIAKLPQTFNRIVSIINKMPQTWKEKIGAEARETVIREQPMDKFIEGWQTVLEEAKIEW